MYCIFFRTGDYPLLPENLEITDKMISPYTRTIRTKRGLSEAFTGTKLAPNMLPKKKYVVHLRNLQYYLSLGVVLTKVHRIISFYQEAWIEPYIQQNTILRQQAADDFEKTYYKLLNNAFFGK